MNLHPISICMLCAIALNSQHAVTVTRKMWEKRSAGFRIKSNRYLADKRLFKRCEGDTQKNESGLWCLLEEPDNQVMPLADQIEMSVVRYLDRHLSTSLQELDAAMCRQFTGLNTPPVSLLQACLESYAELDSQAHWPMAVEAARKTGPPAARHSAHAGKTGRIRETSGLSN
jgi:hypothetical protein